MPWHTSRFITWIALWDAHYGTNIVLVTYRWFWDAFDSSPVHRASPLSVHSVAYQLTFITNALPCAISIGLSVSLGQFIFTKEVQDAKRLTTICWVSMCALAIATSSMVYAFRWGIIHLFASVKQVIEVCLEIWFPYCLFLITLYIYSTNLGILTAGCKVVAVLWFGAFPLCISWLKRQIIMTMLAMTMKSGCWLKYGGIYRLAVSFWTSLCACIMFVGIGVGLCVGLVTMISGLHIKELRNIW